MEYLPELKLVVILLFIETANTVSHSEGGILMEITWHGHSCFSVESANYRIILDPYMMDTYPALHVESDMVLCSHGHADHNNVSAVAIRNNSAENPFTIDKVDTFHDEENGKLRGKNVMHILRAEELTLVHCGDLGHFPTSEQLDAISNVDALLIPVGGFFTIDAAIAKRIVDAANPRVVVPMHFRHGEHGYPQIGILDDFTDLFQRESVHFLNDNHFTLTKDEPSGVIVPRYLCE